ncbi:hypothetical protein CDD83_10629 [Cordyceps sp. RAO-2017]|nr:hypothetical protein CDD83_10629 [Cordyceps sp. RAO-2017]
MGIEHLDSSCLPVPLQTTKKEVELVCFGTVPEISAKCTRPGSHEIPSTLQVQLQSSDRFETRDLPGFSGHIPSKYGQMIQGLLNDESLQLEVSCIVESEPAGRHQPRAFARVPCVLEMTVYGPIEIFDEIGSWFEEYDVFLQDPQLCHLDVKYCNPHRLSSADLDSCPMVSEVIARRPGLVHLQAIEQRPDLLDILDSSLDLEEAPQPRAIRTTLKRHQRQALTFMLRREEERPFETGRPNIWEAIYTDEKQSFFNMVSNTDQSEEPRQFYGGIISDPMGFGKTLTMIALTATDLESVGYSTPHTIDDEDGIRDVAATLVIVPPPLLDTWEEQLSQHVHDKQLRFYRHHGKSRLARPEDAGQFHAVLTTYHTVSAERKAREAASQSPLFSVRWRRIILDEAHFVRNGNSLIAKAVFALRGASRWAVTGTPIQNRLSDLAALVRFIRADPYDDPKRFDSEISRLWKSGEDAKAVMRLKRLAACLLLRRARGTICLPPRQDLRCPVEFSRGERILYDELRDKAIARLDEALEQDSELAMSGVYVNVLQQIESLRLFCNLGAVWLST